MLQYRQVLVRLCQGDSDRDIASRLMDGPRWLRFEGWRRRRAGWRQRAHCRTTLRLVQPWGHARRAHSTISNVEPHRTQVERWVAEGVGGIAIHADLCREHGYRGCYSAAHRVLAGIHAGLPMDVTVRLLFPLLPFAIARTQDAFGQIEALPSG